MDVNRAILTISSSVLLASLPQRAMTAGRSSDNDGMLPQACLG